MTLNLRVRHARTERAWSRPLAPLSCSGSGGYLLIECLVYIGLVVAILMVGYAALYRCIDSSVALRRNANDITSALSAGERWRADIRLASGGVRKQTESDQEILRLSCAQRSIDYRFSNGKVERRTGSGPWTKVLQDVAASRMQADERQNVTAWSWELELQPKGKGSVPPGRVRPLFTFLAVPQSAK